MSALCQKRTLLVRQPEMSSAPTSDVNRHAFERTVRPGYCNYLIQPALTRAFIMSVSQYSRDTFKRSRIPGCLTVFPSFDSLQPSRSSVAQSARSSIDFMPCSPKATSIRVVTPGKFLRLSSTPSSFRLASKFTSRRCDGSNSLALRESPLRRLDFDEGTLDWRRLGRRAEPFQRRDLSLGEERNRRHTGEDRFAIDQDRAGAALAEPAAELRGVEFQLVTQHVK